MITCPHCNKDFAPDFEAMSYEEYRDYRNNEEEKEREKKRAQETERWKQTLPPIGTSDSTGVMMLPIPIPLFF